MNNNHIVKKLLSACILMASSVMLAGTPFVENIKVAPVAVCNTDDTGENTVVPNLAWSELAPQFSYQAAIGETAHETFHRTFQFAQGTSQHISIESPDAECYYYIFNVNNLNRSWSGSVLRASGDTMYRGSKTVNIPETGTYMLLVTTTDNSVTGHCNVTVGSDNFQNQVVGRNYYAISTPADGKTYNYVATSRTANPMLFVLQGTNSGKVVAYNNDYAGEATYDWEETARVKQSFNYATSGVLVALDSHDGSEHKFDVYGLLEDAAKERRRLNKIGIRNATITDLMISAPTAPQYDGLAWAVGNWQEKACPGEVFSSFDDLESYFRAYGYTSEGATHDNSVIDVYGDATEAKAVLVKRLSNDYAAGYSWEMKHAGLYRYFLPRNAIDSLSDAHVSYYRKMTPSETEQWGGVHFTDESVYESYQFTANERSYVEDKLKAIDDDTYFAFEDLFVVAYDTLVLSSSNGFSELEASAEYQELQSMCRNRNELLYLVMNQVSYGNLLAVKLLGDVYAEDYPVSLDHMKKYCNDHLYSADGKAICRTMQARAMLFAKDLLAEDMQGSTPQSIVSPEGITRSNDADALVAKVNGRSIEIAFDLEREARVSVHVFTTDGKTVGTHLDDTPLSEGHHALQVNVRQAGVYLVSYIENGCIFIRKVKVE